MPTPTAKQEIIPGPKIKREVKVKREYPDSDGSIDMPSQKHPRLQPTKDQVIIELE
jgi:hypothetical protein